MKNIYWFTHDLRVKDNTALAAARATKRAITGVYLFDPNDYAAMGHARQQFTQQCLQDLRESLAQLGIPLKIEHVAWSEQGRFLNTLCRAEQSNALFVSAQCGSYERATLAELEVDVHEYHNNTLFEPNELPFSLNAFPQTFSKARRIWENDQDAMAKCSYEALLAKHPQLFDSMQASDAAPLNTFEGGEQAAAQHLQSYFATQAASHYKHTRNSLDGWLQSTKFSPWLAHGCLSPLQVLLALRYYETRHGANESTYWIFFELLWREYFFWYARTHCQRLFSLTGVHDKPAYDIKHNNPALRAWQQGNTEFPLVNACMRQLNETGFISNRGRQLAASCLINELQLDWRLGAQYFEQHLIDYDVASNWGNWQYLAGVGADPRGLRRFDQAKQQRLYDPYGEFIKRWKGYANQL